MKIVNRKVFLAMPKGILFSKFSPNVFGPLEIKGESIGENDFWAQQIADAVKAHDSNEYHDKIFEATKTGETIELDFDCEYRDGLFEDEQLFAIWEAPDVQKLIDRLSNL